MFELSTLHQRLSLRFNSHYRLRIRRKPEINTVFLTERDDKIRRGARINRGNRLEHCCWDGSGDGRCLFRSVVHGACLRTGKPSPTQSLEKELADELRANVVNEFIKRRADSEWYLDGDFDTYITHMRQPHVWGGEPELLMASHVLKMPINVYMLDKKSNALKTIAAYGQGYGKENPIHVLYHGYGHYDVLKNLSRRSKD